MNKIEEALGILQEECAEVIVEVSKIRRFGIDTLHYKEGIPHNKMLEREVGDVLAMIDILIEQNVLNILDLNKAKIEKKEKLKKWSNIFDTESK
jgi:kynurenine formamidase